MRTRIFGTGTALPDRVVTNDDLTELMDTSDEWIRTRTGIRERRWVREGETGAEMGLRATEQALAMAGMTGADLDAIVYATSSPDHFAPGNGVFLQRILPGAGPAMERIDAKLAELDRMRRALARLAATCRTPHPPDECPILTALDPVV